MFLLLWKHLSKLSRKKTKKYVHTFEHVILYNTFPWLHTTDVLESSLWKWINRGRHNNKKCQLLQFTFFRTKVFDEWNSGKRQSTKWPHRAWRDEDRAVYRRAILPTMPNRKITISWNEARTSGSKILRWSRLSGRALLLESTCVVIEELNILHSRFEGTQK